MGGRAIACINARDRNVLGFQRDLLTAAAYGVREFLFVYGDRPETGARSDDLTVRRMLDEARTFSAQRPGDELQLAVTTRPTAMPSWKLEADALFVQVIHDVEALVDWRRSISFDGPVYAGVIVFGSPAMARKLSADVPQLAAPPSVVATLERDPSAGVRLALETVAAIEGSGAFTGAHVIPVRKYRELAAALEHHR
jgi:methylenetetrahydrofolate reductase (NADPH)